ncbi:hypothetical protein V6Z11_A05G151200 [Gossypium hirsutum]
MRNSRRCFLCGRECKGPGISQNIINVIVFDIGFIILEVLKVGLEIIGEIDRRLRVPITGSLFRLRFSQIGPQVVSRHPTRPHRSNKIRDYSTSTHGSLIRVRELKVRIM